MGKTWRKSIFMWKLPSKLLQLCSQSEVYNDATRLLFVHLIWCCCVYNLHPFDFYGIFYVCKQHSLTWNISQFKCQPLNTQNGQSIFLHAYGQFLVLCEHWELSEWNQRNKMNLSGPGGWWRWSSRTSSLQTAHFTDGKLRSTEGEGLTQDHTASERQSFDENLGLLLAPLGLSATSPL